MSDEKTNICVVVALWRVLSATWGRAMAPSRVVTVYIYLTIGARFAVWTESINDSPVSRKDVVCAARP